VRRVFLFIAVVVTAVVVLISFAGTFLSHQTMMSGMMGEGYSDRMGFFWPTMFTVSIAVVVVVVTYIALFPEIRSSTLQEKSDEYFSDATGLSPMDIVMRVSKSDERAVLGVLKASGGVCFQRDITYRTGFSKIKTHRIVARLADRGLIQVKKTGKTNEIRIPNWLKAQSQ